LPHSFPREQRLLNADDFRRVFDEPLKSSDACFTVLARSRESQSSVSRLGLAIAKKQLRRAVDRNRIKRLARETFRQQVPKDCAMDFVVMARAVVSERSNAELMALLQRHFLGLIKQLQDSHA
jgi:ribonuclease P protein component